jgi:hypothetical protein
MAQAISINVYNIDGNAVPVVRRGFPVAQSGFRPFVQNADGANASLYGIIETSVFGRPQKFGVVETVAQLVTAANA